MAAPQLVQLQVGEMVDRWHIDKKLGEGGFGAVYLVSDPTGTYALKVEGVNEQIQVLKMEVYVLTELMKRNSRHFCKIMDKGRYGSFNYVVMTVVGKSLQVRAQRLLMIAFLTSEVYRLLILIEVYLECTRN
ncbi:unnamed protein product [Toxocara canis]|uniref:Protein kinase domain-containing protein n=1 Tax=Toxocara canis TaxID=6265 RepID=A0A183U5T3_TOXCA|nr:unnamed protein product [Toxocara canis]